MRLNATADREPAVDRLKFRRAAAAPEVYVSGQVHGDLAEIVIEDNGIGFDPRESRRIFRVFERLGAPDAYPEPGSAWRCAASSPIATAARSPPTLTRGRGRASG